MRSGTEGGGPDRAETVPPDFSVLCEVSKGEVLLRAHVQPGARTEGIAGVRGCSLFGVHGASLMVRLRAPAVSGKANRALLALLARELGVPAAALILVSGMKGRDKRIAITSLSAAEVGDRLAAAWRRAEGAI